MLYSSTSTYYIGYLSTRAMKWQQHLQVPSDCNLGTFLQFVNKAPLELQQRLLQLPMIQHEPTDNNIQIKLKDGKMMELSSIACTAPDCTRCLHEVGGYKFHYIGTWTCRRAIGLAPHESRRTWMTCTDCTMCANKKGLSIAQ